MRLLALLLFSAGPVVLRGPSDAGCQLSVDDVTLVPDASKCAPTKLNERYPVGTIGEATFVARSEQAYAGRLSLNAGAEVKPHQHDTSMEIVVIQSGRGTFTLDGGTREVGPGDTVMVPKATQHAFTAGKEPVRAVQFYLPPGPEERFRGATKEKKP
jgi:quercetin dioxygenase-like cupin family protein